MSEQLPDRLPAGDEYLGESDCNRCLKSLIAQALDGSGTPVETHALMDSIDPSFSTTTSDGQEVLAMVCRVENCFETSFFRRLEQQTTPAPVTAREVQFPRCIAEN